MDQWKRPQDELPRPLKSVLVAIKTMYTVQKMMVTVARYVPRRTVLAEDFLDDNCDEDFFDVDEDGKEYTPEGWYECPIEPPESFMIGGDIEYWMDIPVLP